MDGAREHIRKSAISSSIIRTIYSTLSNFYLFFRMLNEDEGPDAKKAKFAPPTIEEVAALRESENIYSGRLSQLKIEEILNEISLSESSNGAIRSFYEILSKDLKNTTCKLKSVDLEDLPAKIGKVCIPLDMKPKSVKGIMKLIPPEAITLDPIYKINGIAQIGDLIELNLIVKLPQECLQEKDHWDQRYFRKRAIYLGNCQKNITVKI